VCCAALIRCEVLKLVAFNLHIFCASIDRSVAQGGRIYHSVIHYKQQKEPGRLEVDEARKGGDDVVTIWSQDRSLCCEDETVLQQR